MNIENKRLIIGKEHITEADYPFTIEPKFSILGSFMEISKHKPLFSFLPDDCLRNLLGYNAVTLYEEYKL